MSLAADTRAAVRERPYLIEALRAGVVNYAAAARRLDLDADEEAVATALRRFASDLQSRETASRETQVTMQSGLDVDNDDPVFRVGETGFAANNGSYTGIIVEGEIDTSAAVTVLGQLRVEGVSIKAAGFTDRTLVIVVERRDGGRVLKLTETALEAVPNDPTV